MKTKPRSLILITLFMFACSSQGSDSKSSPKSSALPADSQVIAAAGGSGETPKAEVVDDRSDSEKVDPPTAITGAYMTATILPKDGTANVIRFGIVGMLDDIRLSDKDELYKSLWTLSFKEPLPLTVKISKSADKTYDQVVEFFGSDEQLTDYAAKIDISLQFQENKNGAMVNTVVVSPLSDLYD
jgi:hypothetical protein